MRDRTFLPEKNPFLITIRCERRGGFMISWTVPFSVTGERRNPGSLLPSIKGMPNRTNTPGLTGSRRTFRVECEKAP